MSQRQIHPAIAEGLGTGLLLFIVVGSGFTTQRITGEPGIQLVVQALAVGAGLAVLIAILARISGSHFNPAVTIGFRLRGSIDSPTTVRYIAAQVIGAMLGVGLAVLTFTESFGSVSSGARVPGGVVVGEIVGTFVLVLAILVLVDQEKPGWVPAAVGAWVAAMILTIPSGAFLNPAVTFSRILTDTDVLTAAIFIGAQLLAGAGASTVSRLMFRTMKGT